MSSKPRWVNVGAVFESPDSQAGNLKFSGTIGLGLLGEIPVIVRRSQYSKHPGMYQLLVDSNKLPLNMLLAAQEQREDQPPTYTRQQVAGAIRGMRPPEGHERDDDDSFDIPF